MANERSDYLVLAELAFNNGEYETALKYCEKAISKNSADVSAYTSAGKVCLILDQIEKAELYFRKTIELDSTVGEYYFNLGNVLFGSERYSEALENYVRADQLGCSLEIKQKIYYLIGLLQQAKMKNENQPNKRIVDAQAALLNFNRAYSIPGLNSDQQDILLRCIQIYVETGDFKNAEVHAEQLKLLMPNEFKSYQLLFQIYLQQQKVEKAESILLEAETTFGNNEQIGIEIAFDRVLIHCFKAEQNSDSMQVHYSDALLCLSGLENMGNLPNNVECEVFIAMAEINLKLENIDDAIKLAKEVTDRNDVNISELAEFVEKAQFILLESYIYKNNYKDALIYATILKKSDNLFYRHHGYYTEAFITKKLSSLDSIMRPKVQELYEKAIAYYRNCMATSPGDLTAAVYRIKSYADLGWYDKAAELSKVLMEETRKPLLEYIQKCKNEDMSSGEIIRGGDTI